MAAMKPLFFETPGEFRAWLKEHHREAGHHLAGSRRPSALFRLDRRCPQAHRRFELRDPVHASDGPEHLERRQHRAGEGADSPPADATGRSAGVRITIG
jgi:hypothetical protein